MKITLFTVIFLFSFQSYASHDKKQIDCIAKNIYYESRGEGLKGMLAVGQVTKNRVESPKYPKDYCKVVFQSKQFSWTNNKKRSSKKELEAWETARNLAKILYWNNLPIDLTKGATHFYSGYKKPYWAKYYEKTVKINNHTFYKEI